MSRWTFEPGHTAAEFCVRHMMVTYVRGHFKNVHGSLEFDPETTQLNRHEFGVSWNSVLDRGGVAVGDDVVVTIDAEAILQP